MQTSRDLAALYQRDGYVTLERLFSPKETASWKEEIRRVMPADGPQTDHGVYVGLSVLSDRIRRVNADPRMVSVLNAIIGPDVEFLSDKLVFKSSNMDFGSPWHQDWHYWHGSHKTSVWIALDDATPENGCLKVLPGSHRAAINHQGAAVGGQGFVHRLKPGEVDESLAVAIAAPGGTAVFFHDLTLHSSFPNTSGKDRWAMISTYRNAAEPDLEHAWSRAAFLVCGTKTTEILKPQVSDNRTSSLSG